MRYATGFGILLIVFCSGQGSNTARAITVQWSLAITDINDQALSSPLTVGQTFWLDVDVDDLRTISGAGVLEGITDILFDPTKARRPAVSWPGQIIRVLPQRRTSRFPRRTTYALTVQCRST